MSKYNRHVYLFHMVAISVIIVLCCTNIQKLDYIAVLNDEFGYWGNAASIAGYDWSSLIAETPYYSLGYSIFLIPIMKIFSSPEFWYKIAIGLNIFFLVMSYFLCCNIGQRVFSKVDKRIINLVSLLTIIFPSNITYAQIAWSETLLYLLVWCMTYCIIRLDEKFSYKLFFLEVFLMIYAYFVHSRSIGLILSGTLCLFMILIKHNKGKWNIILLPLLIIVGYVCVKQISKIQIATLWSNSNLSNMNNLSINRNTVATYFGNLVVNFKLFLESLGGKLLYLIIGTGLTIFGPIIFFTKILIGNIKEKKIWNKYLISQFWCVSIIVIMWILNSLQMLDWSSRKDIIVYSRYMEYVLGPILYWGILLVITNKKVSRYSGIISFILLAIGIRSLYYRVNEADKFFNTICSPIIGTFYDNSVDCKSAFIKIFLVSLIFFIIIVFVPTIKKALVKVFLISGIFFVIFITIGYKSSTYMNAARERFTSSTLPLKEEIEYYNKLDIYYVHDVEHDLYSVNPKYLQFMIPSRSIHVIERQEVTQIEGKCIILVNPLDLDSISYIEKKIAEDSVKETKMLDLYIID